MIILTIGTPIRVFEILGQPPIKPKPYSPKGCKRAVTKEAEDIAFSLLVVSGAWKRNWQFRRRACVFGRHYMHMGPRGHYLGMYGY